MKLFNMPGVVLVIGIFQIFHIHSQDMSHLTLIAHYPLSGTANDTTGNYGPMVLTNTPFQEGGIYCNGIYSGGDPDACDARTPDISAMDLEFFAVSAMFKVDDAPDGRRPVFVCGRIYKWCSTFIDPDSTVGLGHSGLFYPLQSSGVKFTPGAWHEITFSHDSTEGIGRLYLDNVLVDSAAFQNNHRNDRSFTITNGSVGKTFKGFLKDLKVYSKSPSGLVRDSLALVALYDSTDGANWTNNTNWLTGPVSTWFGITVDNDRVKQVDLDKNNLVGVIPPEIGDLYAVTHLYLHKNKLSGSIPQEIGNLTFCECLYLTSNQLEGKIPPEIGNLASVDYLYMGDNQFTGSIPPEIGNLSNLFDFYLHDCQLTGSIPPEIGNCTNLVGLYLYGNQLSDTIPPEIGNLTKLSFLSLQENQLTGSIPPEIGNLEELRRFSFHTNQLSGSIPPEIGNLTELSFVFIHHNQLTGAVPGQIIHATKLEQMHINHNQLDALPDLSVLTSLTTLNVHNNQFTFEDIEPNIGITSFLYFPQDSVGGKQDSTIAGGEILTLLVDVEGTANQYQWYKDGSEINGADSLAYVIESVTFSDSGSYSCEITNTIATDLTLYSRPINVHVTQGTDIVSRDEAIPVKFSLLQNYPNPFNPETAIEYHLPRTSDVVLIIYNLLGHQVRRLVNEKKSAGYYKVQWDGRNDAGCKIASGLYFYWIKMKVNASDHQPYVECRKMLFLE